MRRSWLIITVYILAISLPYLLVWLLTPPGHVFGGFLLNPLDGNSYLAKMQEGAAGKWLFTLPYTAVPGKPVFLFIFYIFLGHISRWFGLPVLLVFHVCRVCCAVYFAMILRNFMGKVLAEYIQPFPEWVFLLVLFGSGSGWLLLPTGYITSDFWVAEAYPFLSGLTNPHFPLGLALMLNIIMEWSSRSGKFWWMKSMILGILLALIFPFGIPILTVILGSCTIIYWIKDRTLKIWDWVAPLGCGGLILVYQYMVTVTHPQLSNWNLQNQTITPPIWDVIVSFSPLVLVFFVGIFSLRKLDLSRLLFVSIVWALVCIPLAYFPFNLQRRLLSGIYIPLAALAPIVLLRTKLQNLVLFNRLRAALVTLSVITNGFILFITCGFTVATMDPMLFITKNNYQGLNWIKENTNGEDVILADENLSMFIPAITGRRVVYGHPYETNHAKVISAEAKDIFSGDVPVTAGFIEQYSIDFVLVTKGSIDEVRAVHFSDQESVEIAFENDSTIIYRMKNQ